MDCYSRKEWTKKLKKGETICDSCSYKFYLCKRVSGVTCEESSNAPCGGSNDYFIYKPLLTLQQKLFQLVTESLYFSQVIFGVFLTIKQNQQFIKKMCGVLPRANTTLLVFKIHNKGGVDGKTMGFRVDGQYKLRRSLCFW